MTKSNHTIIFIVNFDYDQISFTNKFDNCKFLTTIKGKRFNIGTNPSPLKNQFSHATQMHNACISRTNNCSHLGYEYFNQNDNVETTTSKMTHT